ncbi:MAG: response regulator transcription factor [Candidatus Krumholzibacteriia bacterium]
MSQPERKDAGSGSLRPGERTRIGVVDDHPAVRQGLVAFLAGRPDLEICGEAGDPATAIDLVEKHHPNLLLIDISLADGSGLELIKQIRSRFDAVRMLVYSMHDEMLFAERVIRAGASGYVSKSEGLDTLCDAIDQVKRGKIHLSARMTEAIVDRRLRGAAEDGLPSPADLSDRELEVFEALGRGLSTREVADRLNLSVKTVETHRENIKRKLGLHKNVELLQRAFQWVMSNE